jgi:hypothetical protein
VGGAHGGAVVAGVVGCRGYGDDKHCTLQAHTRWQVPFPSAAAHRFLLLLKWDTLQLLDATAGDNPHPYPRINTWACYGVGGTGTPPAAPLRCVMPHVYAAQEMYSSGVFAASGL